MKTDRHINIVEPPRKLHFTGCQSSGLACRMNFILINEVETITKTVKILGNRCTREKKLEIYAMSAISRSVSFKLVVYYWKTAPRCCTETGKAPA